jgi:acetylornithine/N-succinyldiaminopimelate aminotransferase
MNSAQIMEQTENSYMPFFGRQKVVFERGEGCYLYDIDGKRYLDFLSGIAVNALGHNHPGLVAAITAQAGKLIHCSNYFYTEPQAQLSQKLANLSGLGKVFLANSGTEAAEGAIKIARKYGSASGKTRIITAQNSFHGRTLGALKATGQTKYHKGFEPMIDGFDYVPYNDLPALKEALSENVCAVMLEPIQGEGGIIEPAPGYLGMVKKLCNAVGALLIFDEVQTGMGRTGTMFAYQHENVTPDILTLGKGLGGGYPMAAILCTDAVAERLGKGDHGSTFGGNPLGCAAALAVLAAFEKESILENVQINGGHFREKLLKLQVAHPDRIKAVRGRGLLIGMELNSDGAPVVEKCMERGLIINCTAGKVLRFAPALNVRKEHIDAMTAILSEAI